MDRNYNLLYICTLCGYMKYFIWYGLSNNLSQARNIILRNWRFTKIYKRQNILIFRDTQPHPFDSSRHIYLKPTISVRKESASQNDK